MPIYEEKLISPLAIRFTQQRIRMTFRDGRKLESTIDEITDGPAAHSYDVVLQAPFPTIEIVRYSPHGRAADGKGDDDHWFTFDNRRLYCLQRLAAEHWPKHVGAVVHVLYADDGTIRKKLDSWTCGLSVSIGHAFADSSELDSWYWRTAVEERAPLGLAVATAVEDAVKADDAKATVNELMDALGALSSVERLAMGLAEREPTKSDLVTNENLSEDSGHQASASTTNTEIASRGSSNDLGAGGCQIEAMEEKGELPPTSSLLDVVKQNMVGIWTGEKCNTYTIEIVGSQCHVVRDNGYSSKKFTIEQDTEWNCLWWGIQRTYYVCASELCENRNELRWYGARDLPGRRPRFMWHKTDEAHDQGQIPHTKAPTGTGRPPQKNHGKHIKWQLKSQQHCSLQTQQAVAPSRASKGGAVANTGGA